MLRVFSAVTLAAAVASTIVAAQQGGQSVPPLLTRVVYVTVTDKNGVPIEDLAA